MAETVAILGGGVMGETLVSGLLRAGWSPAEVVVSERRPERAAEIAGRYGVRTTTNTDAAASSDTVVLVVKPQDIAALLAEVAGELRPGALVVSIAAGITTAFVEERLPDGVRDLDQQPGDVLRLHHQDDGVAGRGGVRVRRGPDLVALGELGRALGPPLADHDLAG